jgi:hypothetical protein
MSTCVTNALRSFEQSLTSGKIVARPLYAMSNFRLHRTKGFFINFRICDLGLSLKAQGLYLNIRRLAEIPDWEFSVNGLAVLLREGPSAIATGVQELERAGLLSRRRERLEDGRLGGSVWHIYEEPGAEEASDRAPGEPRRGEEVPESLNATRRQLSIYDALPEPSRGERDGGLRSSLELESPPMGDFPRQGFPVLDDPHVDNRGQIRNKTKPTNKTKKKEEGHSHQGEPSEPFPVPESLKTLEAKIRTFWTEHKSKASMKTPQAWSLQMGWLLKILEDPSGGLKEVEAQLDKAEAAAVLTNKPWMAIKYDNWSAFGKKNNNQPAKGNTRPGSTYNHGANPGHTQRIVQKPLEECIDYGKLYRERKNKANQSSPQT